MDGSRILVLPWTGEFGWEVCFWIPTLRGIKKNHPDLKFYIFGRKGFGYFYEDFCEEYFPIDYSKFFSKNIRFCQTSCTEPIEKLHSYCKSFSKCMTYSSVFNPREFNNYNSINGYKNISPVFFKYGENNSELSYDIVFHARNKMDRKIGNWNRESIKNMLDSSTVNDKKICFVGSKEESIFVEGYDDFRGVDSRTQCSIYSNSSLLIGPCSGAIHLGSLCGIKIITWTSVSPTIKRLESNLNPFNVDTTIIKKDIVKNEEIIESIKLL